MKFLKWIWVVVILGALAGMGSTLARKKKIQAIEKESGVILFPKTTEAEAAATADDNNEETGDEDR